MQILEFKIGFFAFSDKYGATQGATAAATTEEFSAKASPHPIMPRDEIPHLGPRGPRPVAMYFHKKHTFFNMPGVSRTQKKSMLVTGLLRKSICGGWFAGKSIFGDWFDEEVILLTGLLRRRFVGDWLAEKIDE